MNKKKYRVVITKNRELYKIIQEYNFLQHAKNKFNKLNTKNQVLFPKKYINYQKLKKTEYELLLLEEISKNTVYSQKKVDKDGRIILETIVGGWKIIQKSPYSDEESFYIYGIKKRLNVAEIMKQILVPRMKDVYQIVMVLNKIVIYNGNDIEVILCKNLKDCKRLYDYLFDFFNDQGIYNLLFLGLATKKMRSTLYNKIQSHTGLTRKELYRTSTRS